MSKTCSSRLVRAAFAAGLAIPAAYMLPAITPLLVTKAQAATQAPTLEQMKATLASYGRFVGHERYGDVWVPSVTPEGWHPYPPCYWAYTERLGWYFDDPTAWGRIVHHYGRWAHDPAMGWIWVPGEEFSPGWVVWRAGESWTGWAPMPPQQDVQTISLETFNNDKHWIFVETPKLGSKCEGASAGLAAASQIPVLIERTKVVTQVKFVEGIAIVVLPAPILFPIVNVHIGIFDPWSPIVIGNVFWAWNWLWNNVSIVVAVHNDFCPDPGPKPMPLKLESSPPPPPPGKKAETKPTVPPLPPRLTQPTLPTVRPIPPEIVVERPRPTLPTIVVDRPRPRPPVIVTRPIPEKPVMTRPTPEKPVVTRPIPEKPVVTRPHKPVVTQPTTIGRVTTPSGTGGGSQMRIVRTPNLPRVTAPVISRTPIL